MPSLSKGHHGYGERLRCTLAANAEDLRRLRSPERRHLAFPMGTSPRSRRSQQPLRVDRGHSRHPRTSVRHALMNGHCLENRTRLAVLTVTAIALLGIGNSAYRASNLCLADGSWKSGDYYKLVALKRIAATDFPRPAGAVVQAARGKSDTEILALIAADPAAVVLGKVGFSEYMGRTFEDWLSGAKSKVVSVRRGEALQGNSSYIYVQSDNCGRPSPIIVD